MTFHTSDSHSGFLCFGTSFSFPLELLESVLAEIRHHAGHDQTNCDSKIIKAGYKL